MHRFSDFAKEETALSGKKLKINEVLGKDIAVTGYRITNSKYKKEDGRDKCLMLQFKLNEEEHILFTGSAVLAKQAEDYKDEMPFLAKIEKRDKYFTFC